MRILFHSRSTTGCSCNDGIYIRRECIEVFASGSTGFLRFADVHGKRAAASLRFRDDNFNAVSREDAYGCGINSWSKRLLGAADQKSDSSSLWFDGWVVILEFVFWR